MFDALKYSHSPVYRENFHKDHESQWRSQYSARPLPQKNNQKPRMPATRCCNKLKKKRVNISKLEPLKKVSLQIKKAVRQQYKTGQS